MSEATAVAEPATEVVTTPAPEVVSTPPPDDGIVIDYGPDVTPPEPKPETPEVKAPEPEAPKADEPPAAPQRTLYDVEADIRANKPVLPSESDAYWAAVAANQKAAKDESDRVESLKTLLPTAGNNLATKIADYIGLDAADLGLRKIIEDELIHGDKAVQRQMHEAFARPVYEEADAQLLPYTNRNPQTIAAITAMPIARKIITAIEIGKALGRTETVGNGEYVSKKDHEKAVEDAKDLTRKEFEAAYPERVQPKGFGDSTPRSGLTPDKYGGAPVDGLSVADIDRMTTSRYLA